jgi:hypothetical protein
MDIFNSLFSPDSLLAEQVARQVFEIASEQGPLVMIIDAEGNCRASNSELFERLNLSSEWIQSFCSRIDDGAEPVISHIHNYGIVGAQLAGEHSKCGYILMAMAEQSPESMLAKVDMVEMILCQFNVIARLLEKCDSLYRTQSKLCGTACSN